MKISAIICEFNPFHNGHKYIIDKAKENGADCVIAIMSGNFVQRGDIAITDKFERAKAALLSGCDLVVEMPTVFALSSAESFARCGVKLADALNADTLCFGAENDDITKLIEIADVFKKDDFKLHLKEQLSNGEYYAKAVTNAIREILSANHAEILKGPNNTLAIEYIKALKSTPISPIAIKRLSVDHDSDVVVDNICSATHLRNLIKQGNDYSEFTKMNLSDYADINEIETAVLYKLRTMTKDEIKNLPDVTEGLENRIFDCAKSSNSLEEFYNNLKTKRYTMSRLRRIVMCALLGITKEHNQSDVEYVRILGMTENGSKLLKNCKLNLLCNFPQDYEKLSSDAKNMFDIDINANNVYSLAKVKSKDFVSEYQRKIIRI